METNSWSSIHDINNWGSGSRKTNSLVNLKTHQPDIGKIYLYTKYRYKAKNLLLINKGESTE